MLIAAAVALPIAAWDAAPAFTDPLALAAGIGVRVTSSVIPYVCDQVAMSRLPRATYALMVALLPATATVIGIIVLTQIPLLVAVLGVVLVIAGIAVHRERDQPSTQPDVNTKRTLPAPTARRSPTRAAECERDGHAAALAFYTALGPATCPGTIAGPWTSMTRPDIPRAVVHELNRLTPSDRETQPPRDPRQQPRS